jgi:hypothetical protein
MYMRTSPVETRIALVFLLLILSFSSSVHAFDQHSVDFIVRNGDNLYDICEKILEDPEDWRWIAMVNRLKNPNRIFPGQKLIIPVRLLKGLPVNGLVTFVKGDVQINLEKKSGWETLSLNDTITQGNWIRTGIESAAEISFGNDFSVFLRPNTTIEILAARRKGALYLLYQLFLETGKSIYRIKQVTGRESRTEIQTPSAVAAPRGTEFRAAVDAVSTTRFEVLDGALGVKSEKMEVEVKAGEGTLVEKDKAPLKPKKLLPPPAPINLHALYRAMPLEFRFERIAGALSYRVMLARDNTFKDVVKEKVIKPEASLQIIGVNDGTYYLQSRSIDDVGLEGIPLEPLELKVRVNPLPPFIQSPTDGAEFREKSVRFSWLKVEKAVQYHLQIAEDPEFNAVVENRMDIKDAFCEIGDLDYKTYYFRVSSIAEDGYQGIWSDTLKFNMIPPPPSPPVEEPKIGDKEIQIRWRSLGEGVTYHFQMAKDKAFQEVLIDESLTKPEIKFEKPGDPGEYYTRVSVIDSEGYEGDFSDPQIFEVKRKFPYGPAGILIGVIVAIILL